MMPPTPGNDQSTTTGVSEDDERRSITERGDDGGGATCCLGIKTPSIILRNIIIPKDMWDEFPQGLNLSISDYFIYQPSFPNRADVRSIAKPSAYGMLYEQVWITTKDGVKLYAFLIKTKKLDPVSAPTMIFFHGNAGSIGDRLENAKILHQSIPINILLVEYRGYGPSKGVPSEKGFYRDAKAAFEYVVIRRDLNSNKIFVFGRSLGGAVAIHLASCRKIRHRIAGLIVENTFTSVPSLAKKLFAFPGIRYLPRWFYNNKYDNKVKVCGVRSPVLFISSKNDELLPPSMMRKLYATAGTKVKEFKELYAGHNDAYLAEEYPALIYQFMQKSLMSAKSKHGGPYGNIGSPRKCVHVAAIPLNDKKTEEQNTKTKEMKVEQEKDDEDEMWEDVNCGSPLESSPGTHRLQIVG